MAESAKAVRITTGFGIEKLTTETIPVRDPGHREVLVRIHAVSLNYRDYLMVSGKYNPNQKLPLTLCSDCAGEVIAVGEGATRFKVGDRVAAIFMQRWISGQVTREKAASALGGGEDGVLATSRVFHEKGLVAVPQHMTYEEAACLPCAGVTAWHALIPTAHLKSGDTVLLQGTGGVSIFGLQIAKASGARVIITSSSDEKLEKARKLGADETINYKTTPEWEKEVFARTDRQGVDVVVEVGGAETFPKSVRSLRPGGHIGVIGNLSGLDTKINLALILQSAAQIHGIYVGSRDMFDDMNRMMTLHKTHPVIDRTFKFEEAKQALEYMKSGSHFGKIVIKVA